MKVHYKDIQINQIFRPAVKKGDDPDFPWYECPAGWIWSPGDVNHPLASTHLNRVKNSIDHQ